MNKIKNYIATNLKGATQNDLSSFSPNNNDRAFVAYQGEFIYFVFDSTSAAEEKLTPTYVVQPNTGSGRWVQQTTIPEGVLTTLVELLAETQSVHGKILPDNHQVSVSNQLTDFAKESKQLPDNHQVTVSNPTANPETGLAKNETLEEGITTYPPVIDDIRINASTTIITTESDGVITKAITKTVDGASYGKTIEIDGDDVTISPWFIM